MADGKLEPEVQRTFLVSLLGGAVAGASVDVVLYPLDTFKTRLQSQYGFWVSGGFQGVYKGIGPLAVGSPISGGLFFATYDTFKFILHSRCSEAWWPCVHVLSASIGEVVCCVAKVPMEIVKQRRQASYKNLSAAKILKFAVKEEGIRGLYRGYGSTILRDVPFSMVEFPVWEWLKVRWKCRVKRELKAAEVAACGAIAGGIAAAVTTPLDVVKTRIMLANSDDANSGVFKGMENIYRKQGIQKLFAGFVPRVLLIMMGGALFFGIYETSTSFVESRFASDLFVSIERISRRKADS